MTREFLNSFERNIERHASGVLAEIFDYDRQDELDFMIANELSRRQKTQQSDMYYHLTLEAIDRVLEKRNKSEKR